MTFQVRNRPYKYLAEFYDRIFVPGVSAVQEAARRAVLGEILPQVRSACDLACGTGTTAVTLAKRGIRVFAVDNSPAMRRLTGERARTAGAAIQIIRADMRNFRLPEPVDLVLCEGDAINHLDCKEDLNLVAKSVASALRPGGWFYVDANNRAGFKSYWKDTWWNERSGVVAVMRNGNDAAHDKAWCDIEWFIHSERGRWYRRHERVQEVCWSATEIRSIFSRAGLTRVRAYDASPYFQNPLITPGCRTLYLAQKASQIGASHRAVRDREIVGIE